MKRLAILGSTGSIGEQTLDVVAANPDRFEVVSLAAGQRVERLVEQTRQFRPKRISIADAASVAALREAVGPDVEVSAGETGLVDVATQPADLVVAGLVGAVGLGPVLAAIRAGCPIGLANKEVMVMAGALVRREAAAHDVAIIPIDSEHSAIFQCLIGSRPEDVERLILTCSGGPFRSWDRARIEAATVEEALAHPNWSMGDKISIDSATLMNKGLEVIEACCLFGIDVEDVEVVVHPQSIVHSMVRYRDGSVLAQLGNPDMRTPIAHALGWPQRIESGVPMLDLVTTGPLEFSMPDMHRFPCLELAITAARQGGAAPVSLNAANEIAVAAFLDRRVPFTAIGAIIGEVLAECSAGSPSDLGDILEIDGQARRLATDILGNFRF